MTRCLTTSRGGPRRAYDERSLGRSFSKPSYFRADPGSETEQAHGSRIPLLTARPPSGKVPSGGAAHPMPRVLIIQDDPAVLALMRHGLVRRGYEVDAVRSAHEAMDRLKTERPDLVVSD